MNIEQIEPFADVILKLLSGVLSYDDSKSWGKLIDFQSNVRDYFARIGLALYLNETDGYAYLTQPSEDENGQSIPLPRLTRRRQLTYHQTLLCVLLRERLDEFDSIPQDSERLILSHSDIYEMMHPFLGNQTDERKLDNQVRMYIRQVTELGFLRPLKRDSDDYIVQRILKSKLNADKLAEIKEKLKQHAPTQNDE